MFTKQSREQPNTMKMLKRREGVREKWRDRKGERKKNVKKKEEEMKTKKEKRKDWKEKITTNACPQNTHKR